MNIAIVIRDHIFTSWNLNGGIATTLRRMGHTVHVCEEIPGRENFYLVPDGFWDFVLVSGPEHRRVLYGGKPKVVVNWFHETLDRDDHDFRPAYEQLVKQANINYFIRKEDAEVLGGRWLPFSIDDSIFNVNGAPDWDHRLHKIAFVGQLYEARLKFLDEYNRLGGPAIELLQFVGQDAKTPEEMARSLADSHRNTQIFVVLPTMIRTTPCKVFEAAACGCAVVAPRIGSDFSSIESFYYDERDIEDFATAIGIALDSGYAPTVAQLSYNHVMASHRLEQRLAQIIDDVKGL